MRASRRWSGGLHTRAPLRVKLVATLLLLVAAALVGSGLAATATLRGYLTDRVDTQLQSVAHHALDRGGPGGPGGGAPGGPDGSGATAGGADGDRPGLPSAFVTEVTDASGRVVYGPTSNLIDSAQPLPRLPHPTGAQSQARGSHAFTVGAVRGDGQWRALAVPVALATGGSGTLLVAQSLTDVQNTVGRLEMLLLAIGGVAVVVLAGVGYVVVRASLRPLREVEQTAAAIAAGDLSQRVPDADPRTEVGQLSMALNGMLSQIESAFAVRAASEEAARRSEENMRRSEAAARHSEERMRRFVADASHELRTPLTSIRGFAELFRQGAADDPADLRRLMRRIEDEAKRMGVLVEDLLLLARMDQQRPLEQAPVDVLTVAADAVEAARAIDPDRPVELRIGRTQPPPVVIGDDARLRQILGNLVGNALRHTPPGTPVTVTVDTEPADTEPVDNETADIEPADADGDRAGPHGAGATVVVEVADEGPGMTAEDAARIFERFYRADTSRARSDGGTGLGLAIVAALVAGHGGGVTVDTAPGAGARFRVRLPLADVPLAAPR